MTLLIFFYALLFNMESLIAPSSKFVQSDGVSVFSGAKLNQVDSLEVWNYEFTYNAKKPKDSVELLGSLLFWRIRPIIDSSHFKIHGSYQMPFIRYTIFKLSDSVFCRKISLNTKIFSNCTPPDVGGDYFVIGKFIFLNEASCLNCRGSQTGIDYCRPLVYLVMSKIDKKKVRTLNDIFRQFVIREGDNFNKS